MRSLIERAALICVGIAAAAVDIAAICWIISLAYRFVLVIS